MSPSARERVLNSFWEQWLGAIVFGVDGLLFSCIGLGVLWSRLRAGKH